MKVINPIKTGVILAAAGGIWHLTRIGLVALGKAQPHTIGSLTFPQTAAVIITVTVVAAFLLGFALAYLWNRYAAEITPKRLALAVSICVVLVGAGLIAWNAVLRPVTVQVARIERDVPVQVFGLGTIEARVQSKIGFKVAGVLVELTADVGDPVAKGAVLARLDSREQAARLARARAAVEQAEASLQRAKANVEKAEVNHANARRISDRRKRLAESNITSAETAETAEAVAAAAAADANLARSDIAVAQAAIGDAKAQKEQEAATFDFHTLTAPYGAMVITRQKELGSALAAGEPVFTIIDPRTVWVLAFIDEAKAGEIAAGQPAEIVVRSQPSRRIAGRVARIEPESDRVNEERRIAVAFGAIPEDFNLGEQAEVYITTVHLARTLLVPEAAIENLGRGAGMVWTVEDGRLQQHRVTLGHRLLDGRYEITGGLPQNAAVVTQLTGGLRVGRSASLVEAQTR